MLPDVAGGMGALPPWRPATAANLRCWSRELTTKRQRKAIARPVDGFNVVWSTARPQAATPRTAGAHKATMGFMRFEQRPPKVAVLVPLQLSPQHRILCNPLKPLLHLLQEAKT